MRTKIGQLLIAFALVAAVGGHWAVLQSVAWVGMVVSYSQDDPLAVALEKTFDGQHPCNLCKAVSQGKKNDQKKAAQKCGTKLDLFRFVQETLFVFPPAPDSVAAGRVEHELRAESPPTPPPRG